MFPDGYLIALDLLSGKFLFAEKDNLQIWQLSTGSVAGASNAWQVMYINGCEKLYALDLESGKLLWQFQPDQYNPSGDPVVSNGNVYMSAEDGNLYALR